MSGAKARSRQDHGADPWWGDDHAVATTDAAPAVREPRRRRGTQRRSRSGLGWVLLGLLVAPVDLFRRLLARSPRLRRLAIRTAVVLGVLVVLACSVGVILINNLVISRTAELGELDSRRRELRRDNALLSAEARRRSGPDVVFRRADRELGMVRTPDVPQFVWAVPGSKELTPIDRRRAAVKATAAARKAQAPPSETVAPAATARTEPMSPTTKEQP